MKTTDNDHCRLSIVDCRLETPQFNRQSKIVNRKSAQRGTALLELAIFGMAALAALGFLIRVGMQMNYDQEIRMGAFRRALASAAADNAIPGQAGSGAEDAMAVTHHAIADRQMPNPTDGFMSLPRSRTEASAFVEWGNRLTFAYEDPSSPNAPGGRQTQPRTVIRLNGAEESYRQNDFPETTVGGGTISGAFNGTVTKHELRNNSGGTIDQDEDKTWVSTGTTTTYSTDVNLKGGPHTISSGIGGGGSANWQHQ